MIWGALAVACVLAFILGDQVNNWGRKTVHGASVLWTLAVLGVWVWILTDQILQH